MADGNVIRTVKSIIEGDASVRAVVVSAPGKRYSGDLKITDVLYAAHCELKRTGGVKNNFSVVRTRFEGIVKQLNLDLDITAILDETERRILEEQNIDFTASRGEYLSARVLSCVLGAEFIDAEDVIFFDEKGLLDDEKSYKAVSEALSSVRVAVIPGFYGRGANGKVKTFSRGGSDISGAVVARAVNATVYENWTDVSGFLACDPRIVDNPRRIKSLSYKELRELSYMGADVLHSESIFPVRKANIPIHIKNTFRPEDEGTEIVPTSRFVTSGNTVTGIAGKKNFVVIYVEKSLMNSEIGFMRKVLSVVESEGVPLEHIPSGIDTISLVIPGDSLNEEKLNRITDGIRSSVRPDVLRVIKHVSLIATVGHGLSSAVGAAARLFKSVSEAGINVKMIDQGTSELDIAIGVSDDDYERCIKAIYKEFFGK